MEQSSENYVWYGCLILYGITVWDTAVLMWSMLVLPSNCYYYFGDKTSIEGWVQTCKLLSDQVPNTWDPKKEKFE